MSRTRVKICGVMSRADSQAAVAAGADAIGLIFHPAARRCIGPDLARDILMALPAFVTPVGLFVNASVQEVRQTAQSLALRHIQLHGHEPPETVAELREFRVLKAITVDRGSFAQTLAGWRDAGRRMDLSHLAGLVLETANTAQVGGSGIANDWQTVARARADGLFEGLPPIIAAGGLRPQGVGAVVRQIRPWAVDVSSGVEATFGTKSPDLLAAFCAAVRDADASAPE